MLSFMLKLSFIMLKIETPKIKIAENEKENTASFEIILQDILIQTQK